MTTYTIPVSAKHGGLFAQAENDATPFAQALVNTFADKQLNITYAGVAKQGLLRLGGPTVQELTLDVIAQVEESEIHYRVHLTGQCPKQEWAHTVGITSGTTHYDMPHTVALYLGHLAMLGIHARPRPSFTDEATPLPLKA